MRSAAIGDSRNRRASVRAPVVALGEPAQREQAEVGIGCVREPAEHRREQLLHDARAAGEPGGQLVERGARLLDVAEAERGQPFLRGVHRQRADAGQRVEQRREEQLLVDRAHDRLLALVLGVELLERGRAGAVAEAEHAREARARVGVGRQRVRLVLVDELQPVLDRAQPHVRVVEPVRVGDRDVAAAGELLERVERRRRADRVVVATVHELEELHRELDVADAAVAALQLARLEPLAREHLPRCAPSSRAPRARRPDRARRATRTARRRATNAAPSSASPATGRALMSAWSSQVCAHRSQYASYASSVRLSAPERPSGRRSASVRNTMPSAVGSVIARSTARAARSASALSPSCTNITSTSLA